MTLLRLSQLFSMVKKNIRRLTHSKLAALMIIVGPLIIMILAGVAFDQAKLYGIKVGTYASTYDNLSQTIIDSIQKRDFKVLPYTTKEACIESVRVGQTHVCIEFSKKNDKTHLLFNVDYSKLNLVYTLINTLSSGLDTEATKISLGLAGDLFSEIGKTAALIDDNANTVSAMYARVSGLDARLNNITNVIDSVNTSLPTLPNLDGAQTELEKSNSDISKIEGNITKQAKSYKEQLDDLEKEIIQVDNSLRSWDTDAVAVKGNLSDAYVRMSCSSKKNVLTTINSVAIVQKLQESTDPTCDLLYSMEDILDERTNSLSTARTQVSQLKRDIAQAKKDLSVAQDGTEDAASIAQARIETLQFGLAQLETTFASAKTRADELEQLKKQLRSEVVVIKQTLSSGLSDLQTFNKSLAVITNSIGAMAIDDPSSLVEPISADVKPLLSNKKVLDYLFPSLLVFVVTFTGILLASTIVMKEKASPAFFRNFITPVPQIYFLLGSYLTSLFILLVQMLLLFILASLFFGVSILSAPFSTIFIVVVTCSIFTSIGVCIGSLFKTEETTTLVAIGVSCILLLFSSLIVPIENIRSSLATLLHASPFVLADSALRKALLFGSDITTNPIGIGVLVAYALVLFYLSYRASLLGKRLLEKQ